VIGYASSSGYWGGLLPTDIEAVAFGNRTVAGKIFSRIPEPLQGRTVFSHVGRRKGAITQPSFNETNRRGDDDGYLRISKSFDGVSATDRTPGRVAVRLSSATLTPGPLWVSPFQARCHATPGLFC